MRTDKISVLKIETVQLVAGLLCVHDIFVHDEGGAFGIVGDSLTDLAGIRVSVPHTCALSNGVENPRTARGRICRRGRIAPPG